MAHVFLLQIKFHVVKFALVNIAVVLQRVVAVRVPLSRTRILYIKLYPVIAIAKIQHPVSQDPFVQRSEKVNTVIEHSNDVKPTLTFVKLQRYI